MNLAEFSLRNRTTVMVLTACMLFGGMVSFQGLARYEDPEFTGVSFGFGRPADYTPPLAMPGVLRMGWGGMVQLIADDLGIELDGIHESFERSYAEEAFETPMMRVPKA